LRLDESTQKPLRCRSKAIQIKKEEKKISELRDLFSEWNKKEKAVSR
jgi:hypothetical protein